MITPALISSLLIISTFPPINLYPMAFVGLSLLWIECQKSTLKASILNAGLFGFLISAAYQHWILTLAEWSNGLAATLSWIAASCYGAIFYAGFAWAVKKTNAPLLSWPFFWVFMEWLKTLGPFGNPSALLGHTQSANTLILPLAAWLGVWGLSWMCALSNAFIVSFFTQHWTRLTQTILILSIGLIWSIRLIPPIPKTGQLNVTLIQPNHPQKDKLNPTKWPALQLDYLQILSTLKPTEAPQLICLPEVITPKLNLNSSTFMSHLNAQANRLNGSILFGSPTRIQSPTTRKTHYYNSAVLLSSENEQAQYTKPKLQFIDKEKLMPFGEYIPFRGLIQKLNPVSTTTIDYTPGPSPHSPSTVLTLNNTKISVRICLESVYPRYFQTSTRDGAQALVLLANNAWFKQSYAAEEHLQMSIIRAAENHRTLLHVTNTGHSAIIAPNGQRLSELALNTRGILTQDIPLYTKKTLFTQYPNLMIYLSGLGIGAVLLIRIRRKIKR